MTLHPKYMHATKYYSYMELAVFTPYIDVYQIYHTVTATDI